MIDHPDRVPKTALLFKGKPNGKILRSLKANKSVKDWMLMQVQEEGSYRSEDVVEALDWMLPQAHSPDESIIVLLDWFSGHLTDEVAEKVRSKGHVLLFHGGGTTPFTQINDTHLHASLQRILEGVENQIAEEDQRKMVARGLKRMPSVKRPEIIERVQMTWMEIDHARVAEKGYKQTGPTMPLEGLVAPEDVFRDLLKVNRGYRSHFHTHRGGSQPNARIID